MRSKTKSTHSSGLGYDVRSFRWSDDTLTPASYTLTAPANISAGNYIRTLGLYDPQAAASIPFAGPNGDLVPTAGAFRRRLLRDLHQE